MKVDEFSSLNPLQRGDLLKYPLVLVGAEPAAKINMNKWVWTSIPLRY